VKHFFVAVIFLVFFFFFRQPIDSQFVVANEQVIVG